MESFAGSGPVEATANAVGTALESSPPLQADSLPHPLSVSCHMKDCAFGYDGAATLDGDDGGFDLLLEDVRRARPMRS